MCGIAGIVSTSPEDLGGGMRAMRDRLVHRGPDSAGEFVDQHAALGVRRLRIIDLATGEMPQSNEDATVWTVFNGEIYNFRELREELAARGHRFKTASSDTEVIVHLYEELGERFVERIDGMFAIAVWDTRQRTLVLARDRLGKKPLLYAESAGRIAFASEHDALLRGLERVPPVDRAAIALYLRLGYVPAPLDAFSGVRKLPPAHVLAWRDGRTTVQRYWAPPRPGTLRISEQEAILEVRRLLDQAVSQRLVADVPIGAFLSGGVDSSGVVATMARLTATVRTFSIGFEEAGYSELPHARRIAERYGTEHHEFIVRPDGVSILPLLARHFGEPFADSSAVPTYYLSRLTREHVTVALNGDGGDELFAGYDRYFAMKLASSLDRIPRAVAAPLLAGAARLLPDSLVPTDRRRRTKRFLLAAAMPSRERYLRWLGLFDAAELRELAVPELLVAGPRVPTAFDTFEVDGHDPVASAQGLDLRLYLPDDLLTKVDVASMANSLEVRSPFLDRELVEFAVALPSALKLHGSERKYLLKKALEDRVPAENMYRRKQGFAAPIGAWFRGDLRAFTEDTLLSAAARSRGYFRPERLERLVREHTTGKGDHQHKVWALLMLELWHRELIDAPRAEAAA